MMAWVTFSLSLGCRVEEDEGLAVFPWEKVESKWWRRRPL
jgi:hypothetical protein